MIADICIIGDGYSSTILLLNLARKKFDLKKVIIVGPDQLGAGQAFAHHGFDYRLNGPADRIKILKDEPYDCLLYTSPSPRDATLSRMPSSA